MPAPGNAARPALGGDGRLGAHRDLLTAKNRRGHRTGEPIRESTKPGLVYLTDHPRWASDGVVGVGGNVVNQPMFDHVSRKTTHLTSKPADE